MTDILLTAGAQTRFYVSGSFSPADAATNWSAGTPTDVALTLAGVLNDQGRQSAKADLGSTWAMRHGLWGCVDFTGETPTQGGWIDYFWAPSTSSTPANGNVAGNSGADADAPDGALGSLTLDDFLRMIGPDNYIGALFVHDGQSVQNGFVGYFTPPSQWGQLVVVNRSGDAFEADDVEMHQVIQPVVTTF